MKHIYIMRDISNQSTGKANAAVDQYRKTGVVPPIGGTPPTAPAAPHQKPVGGFSPEKKSRLEELRKKAEDGTIR